MTDTILLIGAVGDHGEDLLLTVSFRREASYRSLAVIAAFLVLGYT